MSQQNVGVELARLEQKVATLEHDLRNAFTVKGGGSIVYDEDGNVRQVIGRQYDGSFTQRDMNAPPPPMPSPPEVEGILGAVKVIWDGNTDDLTPWPLDFAQVEVHVSTTMGFEPSESTLARYLHQPKAQFVEIAAIDLLAVHFVRLVAYNSSGVPSEATVEVEATPIPAVSKAELDLIEETANEAKEAGDQALEDAAAASTAAAQADAAASAAQTTADGKNTVYYNDETAGETAPVAPEGGFTVDDVWFKPNEGYRAYRWDGTTWLPTLYGADALAAAAITEEKLADLAVTLDKIADGAITEVKIGTDAITAPKIAANAVEAGHIAVGAVDADQIVANAITTAKLDALAVTTSKIAADAVTANEIAANSIYSQHIETSQILAGHIATNQINANHIIADQIQASHIASNQIWTEHIASNQIVAGHIAAYTIEGTNIAGYTITGYNINSYTITASKLSSNSVTAAKIDAGAVTASKVDANAINGMTITGVDIWADTFRTEGSSGHWIEMGNTGPNDYTDEVRLWNSYSVASLRNPSFDPGTLYMSLSGGAGISFIGTSDGMSAIRKGTSSGNGAMLKFRNGAGIDSKDSNDNTYQAFRASNFDVGTSQLRFKDEVEPVALDTVAALKANGLHRWRWKNDPRKRKGIGLIADYLPEELLDPESDGYDLTAVTAFLWETTKGLLERIEVLEGSGRDVTPPGKPPS